MSDPVLTKFRDLIQVDIGKRGLGADPVHNLINACPDDFADACRSLAEHPEPCLAVVTGFYIPTATPPAGETDGPLGAVFLARALDALGIPVVLLTDEFCVPALEAGLAECDLPTKVITLPGPTAAKNMNPFDYRHSIEKQSELMMKVTHLLVIERVGPSHADGRCRTMRGTDVSPWMSPVHLLFEDPSLALRAQETLTTIAIGDGGNEIGMGKIPREVIARNIAKGDVVACRVPTEHLIVAGVSNWGAYALAAGIALLRGTSLDAKLLDTERERHLLEMMVKRGPLVDGVKGKQSATVDGLTWEQYAEVISKIKSLVV